MSSISSIGAKPSSARNPPWSTKIAGADAGSPRAQVHHRAHQAQAERATPQAHVEAAPARTAAAERLEHQPIGAFGQRHAGVQEQQHVGAAAFHGAGPGVHLQRPAAWRLHHAVGERRRQSNRVVAAAAVADDDVRAAAAQWLQRPQAALDARGLVERRHDDRQPHRRSRQGGAPFIAQQVRSRRPGTPRGARSPSPSRRTGP
jgi:hypothetical protein